MDGARTNKREDIVWSIVEIAGGVVLEVVDVERTLASGSEP